MNIFMSLRNVYTTEEGLTAYYVECILEGNKIPVCDMQKSRWNNIFHFRASLYKKRFFGLVWSSSFSQRDIFYFDWDVYKFQANLYT